MGESLKDEHRQLRLSPDSVVTASATVQVVVAPEAPPLQPVRPPSCPFWVPWAQHNL